MPFKVKTISVTNQCVYGYDKNLNNMKINTRLQYKAARLTVFATHIQVTNGRTCSYLKNKMDNILRWTQLCVHIQHIL